MGEKETINKDSMAVWAQGEDVNMPAQPGSLRCPMLLQAGDMAATVPDVSSHTPAPPGPLQPPPTGSIFLVIFSASN